MPTGLSPGAPRGLTSLFERSRPCPAQLHDLGAMDQATTREGDEVALAFAPPRQGGSPFLRAAQVVHVTAREDDAAVDDAGDHRRELSRGDRHHRLVEQPEPFLHSPALGENVSLLVQRERQQVGVAEALPGRSRIAGEGGGSLPVPAQLVLEGDRDQEIAALGAVVLAFEQPVRAPQPAGRGAHVSAQGQLYPDPEGAAHRSPRLAVLRPLVVGAFQVAHRLVFPAEHERSRGEQLDVFGAEPLLLIGLRERFSDVEPRARRIRPPTAFEFASRNAWRLPREARLSP